MKRETIIYAIAILGMISALICLFSRDYLIALISAVVTLLAWISTKLLDKKK